MPVFDTKKLAVSMKKMQFLSLYNNSYFFTIFIKKKVVQIYSIFDKYIHYFIYITFLLKFAIILIDSIVF